MRTVSLLTLAALSTALCAQTAQVKTREPASTIILQAPVGQNCPVGLSARHSQQGAVVDVSPTSKPHGQGYSITFSPAHARSIAEAKITLHGMSGAQVVPVKDHPKTDATESFTVSPSLGGNHLFKSTIYVQKLTGVQWIELNEITFADGTQWHESADSICSVTPNGFMLVAGGH